MTTCDYHDLPVVCGEDFEYGYYDGHAGGSHEWQPVHRIPDPEGIDTFYSVVPCVEAMPREES